MKRDRSIKRSKRLLSPPFGTADPVEDVGSSRSQMRSKEDSRNELSDDFEWMEEERADTIGRLSAYVVPEPQPAETSRLAAELVARWEAGTSQEPEHVAERNRGDRWRRFGDSPPMLAIAAIVPQVRLFSWRFWLASALIVLFAGLCGGPIGTANAHPLMFAMPLLAAAGVATAFRSYGTPMFELEMSCPLSPPQLVFGRLFIVLAYDAVLGLAASGFTDRHGASVALFVLAWLVPLALVSLLTLTVMLYSGVVVGLLASLVVWSLQLILREQLGALYLFASPTATAFAHSCLLGLVLVAFLCGLARHKTRALTWGGGVQDL